MIPAALIPVLGQLAMSGINLFSQMKGAAATSNVQKLAALIPLATQLLGASRQIGDTLQKAQAEGWTANDPRWKPVQEAADKELAAAEARLPAPGSQP